MGSGRGTLGTYRGATRTRSTRGSTPEPSVPRPRRISTTGVHKGSARPEPTVGGELRPGECLGRLRRLPTGAGGCPTLQLGRAPSISGRGGGRDVHPGPRP